MTFIMTRHAFVTLSSRSRHAMKTRQIQDLFRSCTKKWTLSIITLKKMPRHALVTLSSHSRHAIFF